MIARGLDAFPHDDGEVPEFLDDLGVAGIVDIHVHAMPERLQHAVWRFFDRLTTPAWPIEYRTGLDERLKTLRNLGVVRHTSLAYPHQPDMARTLNDWTLDLADEHDQVIPTFTFHAEPSAADDVATALARGGMVAKVHLQVGRFHTLDPMLAEVWQQLEEARTPIVLHASAVYGVDGGEEFCGAAPVGALLDRHPDLQLVIAHLGGPDLLDFLRIAELADHVRMDPSMVLTDPPFMAAVPDELLPRYAALSDRLLFGSDFPSIPHDYAAQVRGLGLLGLEDDALRGILHDNADALGLR